MNTAPAMRIAAALVLAALAAAPSLAARVKSEPVQNGALALCEGADGGTVISSGADDVCCAREATGQKRSYCVRCAPSGSNNCEITWYGSRAPVESSPRPAPDRRQ